MNRLLLVLAALSLAACEKEELNCTTEAAFSVTATIEEPDGTAIVDAMVTYTVDGGAERDCEEGTAGTYLCGVEEAGDFEITATTNLSTNTGTVTVEADACHVIGESLTIVLEPPLQ